jgi:endonuclease YncB( thermonuclease family)
MANNRLGLSLFALQRSLRSVVRLVFVLIALSDLTVSRAVAGEEFSGTVTRVTDGDTFHLSGIDPAIRVWGLDAPERDERGGSAATRAMRTLIDGQPLTCVLVDIDRYQRLVGQCFLPNGRDIAEAMISMGVATEYCRYSRGFYGNC